MDNFDTGTYGAAAGPGTEDDTAYDILKNIIRRKLKEDFHIEVKDARLEHWEQINFKDVRSEHWEQVEDDEVLLREIHRYWFQSSIRRLKDKLAIEEEELTTEEEELTTEEGELAEEDGPARPKKEEAQINPTRPSSWAKERMARKWMLDTYLINGKPLRLFTVEEVVAHAKEHNRHRKEHDRHRKFLLRVVKDLPKDAIIGEAYKGREELVDNFGAMEWK